eukprot:655394-Pyramimonas_sp.AAC.1
MQGRGNVTQCDECNVRETAALRGSGVRLRGARCLRFGARRRVASHASSLVDPLSSVRHATI